MDSKIEVYIENIGQKEKKSLWLHLPVREEKLDQLLYDLTGSETGLEYLLTEAVCPYFQVSEQEDLRMLNKTAGIIERLDDQDRILLKAWCDKREQGVADAEEIANAALQTNQMVYLDEAKDGNGMEEYPDAYRVYDFNGHLKGIVLDDSQVDEFLFDREELLGSGAEELLERAAVIGAKREQKNYLKACMRAASAQAVRPGKERGWER